MEELRRRFSGVALFAKVYVSEAHPIDGWKVYSDIDYGQPTVLAERLAAARRLLAEQPDCFPLAPLPRTLAGEGAAAGGWTMLVDGMRNEAEKAYAAHPERVYVIDRATGEVAFKGEMGPFGYLPSALRQFLETL